jgi:hypothetical protein
MKTKLLIDVSLLVEQDYKTGIHRVVRALSTALLALSSNALSVELIYSPSQTHQYRIANSLKKQAQLTHPAARPTDHACKR